MVTPSTCQTRLVFGSNRIHHVGVMPYLLQGVVEEEVVEKKERIISRQ